MEWDESVDEIHESLGWTPPEQLSSRQRARANPVAVGVSVVVESTLSEDNTRSASTEAGPSAVEREKELVRLVERKKEERLLETIRNEGIKERAEKTRLEAAAKDRYYFYRILKTFYITNADCIIK